MRKILIFLLVFASFSCATLDNNLKDKPNVEKNVEEAKKESDATIIEGNIVANKSEGLEKQKENVSPTGESKSIPAVQKEEEEKTPVDSSNVVELREEKKEESKKEEKADTKKDEESVEEGSKRNDEKKDTSTISIESKEIKAEEGRKAKIADEKALQDYSDLFSDSSKVEQKKDTKKDEQNKILPSLEILKELEEAINFFQKTLPSIARQRVEKKEKSVEKEETKKVEEPKVEPSTSEVTTKDETPTQTNPPIASFNDDGGSEYTFNDDDGSEYAFNDDGPTFSFNDEEPVFSFDDEKKNDVVDGQNGENKGQLSSVVDEEDKVNISRYTNIVKGQNIDFSYPGEGWVYLGEETSQKGLNYIKRKMEDGKTIFRFTAENVGNYVLNFSYFDGFSGDFIVDAVSVKVVPSSDGIKKDSLVLEYQGKDEKKIAQTQPKKIPDEVNVDADKVGINTEGVVKENVGPTEQSTNSSNVENNMEAVKPNNANKEKVDSSYKEPEVFTNVASISPENAKTKISGEDAKKIIDEVSEAILNGNAKKALERLDDFFVVSSTNMDEAYFLRGKAYELNTEQKNIKMALAAYKFLTKTFPNSPFWNEADARIRYIEKFFVKIK